MDFNKLVLDLRREFDGELTIKKGTDETQGKSGVHYKLDDDFDYNEIVSDLGLEAGNGAKVIYIYQ